MTEEKILVVDATNAVLGRLASRVSKELLKGCKVNVVNAEKAVIVGNKRNTINKYIKKLSLGTPQHGPFFPRRPDGIVRRTIRGMLPYKKPRGKKAFKNLRVYIGVPDEFKDQKKERFGTKTVRADFVRVSEVSRSLGWAG
jgi:large subunit ribosomal protein L13